ncbi:MAG: SDR family oxidoreductase [Devosiaceae bacterium]|nr:SDR family oxidoreductase [Devosiaceae bacterium]
MENKTVLITGATQGIGYETALGLAKKGAKIVITGRDEERTKTAMQNIISATGNQNISYMVADLSLIQNVTWLANNFIKNHRRLDILINNVGSMTGHRQITKDGFEKTWALNHLSYFLLTNELLPMLKDSGKRGAKSRIINVASTAHIKAELDLDDTLTNERPYNKWQAYGQSKLANIMFTYALATRLEGFNVTANCLHPGVVGTGFIANIGDLEKFFAPLIKLFLISPKKGAKTSIYLASSKEIEDHSGVYFDKEKPIFSSDISYDETLQERLWERSIYQSMMVNLFD